MSGGPLRPQARPAADSTMSRGHTDSWYVRLPDAQVVRANSTRSVRHHIESGKIPPGSHARRSSRESWTPLDQLDAFADLLAEPGRRRPGRERSNSAPDGGAHAHGLELQ